MFISSGTCITISLIMIFVIVDSGVKTSVSTSHNEDEPPVSPTFTVSDGARKKRSRKLSTVSSGPSLRSIPSSPLFDFPTFDELFEGSGKWNVKLSMHHSKPVFLHQQSYPGPTVPDLGLIAFPMTIDC